MGFPRWASPVLLAYLLIQSFASSISSSRLLNKLTTHTPLPGIVQLDDAYWGGKRHDGKRGRGSSAKTPFLAVVSTNIAGHPIYIRLSRVASLSTSEVRNWSLKHLHHQSIVVSDGMQCFKGVTQSGFLHESIVAGGGCKGMEIMVQMLLPL